MQSKFETTAYQANGHEHGEQLTPTRTSTELVFFIIFFSLLQIALYWSPGSLASEWLSSTKPD